MPPTHYELLNVPTSATQEQIKRAYRSLAKALHPDVNPSKDAARKFARLAAAYEVLSHPEKRRRYDRTLRADDEPAKPTTRAHYSWENVASPRAKPRVDLSEFDEVYDTFFGSRSKRKTASETSSHTPPKPKSARSPRR